MELERAIMERRSVRQFTDRGIGRSELEQILEAGIWAPCAGNLQEWEFVCVTHPPMIHKMKVVSPGVFWKPQAIIVVCVDTSKAGEAFGARNAERLSIFDCGMAAQNMMLRAYDLGIGSCAIGSFNAAAVRELLDIPEHVRPELLLLLGCYGALPEAPPRRSEVIHWEGFAQQEDRGNGGAA
ncbi:MAG: nitroreductase family protein [Spirochaetales bacterium]|nr:nitroreductase family protein [Spirochaetales bacterium]